MDTATIRRRVAGAWESLLSGRTGLFLGRLRELQVLDRVYQLSAATFVALIPLTVAVTSLIGDGTNPVAERVVRRFDLQGSAAETVRTLTAHGNTGVYWLGLLIVLWSAVSLGRRLSSTYTTIWGVPRLPVRQQWRALVWVVVQLAMMLSISFIRDVVREGAAWLVVVAFSAGIGAWLVAEYVSQNVLTAQQVARRRIMLAAALVTVGRIGLAIWSAVYMPHALDSQASQYGPLGVVFSMFTFIVASVGVLLIATLLAAVLTSPSASLPERDPGS